MLNSASCSHFTLSTTRSSVPSLSTPTTPYASSSTTKNNVIFYLHALTPGYRIFSLLTDSPTPLMVADTPLSYTVYQPPSPCNAAVLMLPDSSPRTNTSSPHLQHLSTPTGSVINQLTNFAQRSPTHPLSFTFARGRWPTSSSHHVFPSMGYYCERNTSRFGPHSATTALSLVTSHPTAIARLYVAYVRGPIALPCAPARTAPHRARTCSSAHTLSRSVRSARVPTGRRTVTARYDSNRRSMRPMPSVSFLSIYANM